MVSRSGRTKSIAGLGLALVVVTFTPSPATAAGSTTRVSVASDGVEGVAASFSSYLARNISGDGRYVAFTSRAPNLVAEDTNNRDDVFVHDRQTSTTTRVSFGSLGIEGNNNSGDPTISADGRYVAFSSVATNLVIPDTNSSQDVFIHDRQTGATTLVSKASGGTQGNNTSGRPSISADGSHVAFHSNASNLVGGDINGQDVFVHEVATGATTLVNKASGGTQGNGESGHPAISADDSTVAFGSTATNLVAGDTNGFEDVFVHHRASATTTRVSLALDGTSANGFAAYASISADGRYVSFGSTATNLVAGDTNDKHDVFVRDRSAGVTTQASVASDGTQAHNHSFSATLSADGRRVAFASRASNLVVGDATGGTSDDSPVDVFMKDLTHGTVQLATKASDGTQANNSSASASVSADGRFVAFVSPASNLVAGGDANNVDDVFVHSLPKVSRSLSIADATVTEGEAGTRAVFAVTLSKPSTSWVYVNYATAKGTAVGTDFTAKSGTLSFAPGTTTLNVKVAITPDALAEDTETFSVKLSSPSGAVIADGLGVGTIIDND